MIYPMLALILLTFAVAFYLLGLRVLAVRRRQVSLGYFRLYRGENPLSNRAEAAGRHYDNLFQMPLLFYITCLTALTLEYTGAVMLTLAWLYVAARLVHSVIHLGYNNVIHRLGAFFLSNLALLAMWVLLAVHYAGG